MYKVLVSGSMVNVAMVAPEASFAMRSPALLKKSFPVYAVVKQVEPDFVMVKAVE
jgi:hypothetical protein